MRAVAILIGGPCDGRRVAVRSGVRHLLVVEPPRTAAMATLDDAQDARYVQHVQYKEFWGAPGVVCMCPEGMSQTDAVRALIEGYRHEIQGS